MKMKPFALYIRSVVLAWIKIKTKRTRKEKKIIAENENNSVLYAAEQWHIGAC